MGVFGALPCPHCGSDYTGYRTSMDEDGSAGCCFGCGARGPWIKREDIDEEITQAVEAWNRRIPFAKEPVMGLKVEFVFRPKDKVKTALGDIGIVTMVGMGEDNSEPQYCVRTSNSHQWWIANQLDRTE